MVNYIQTGVVYPFNIGLVVVQLNHKLYPSPVCLGFNVKNKYNILDGLNEKGNGLVFSKGTVSEWFKVKIFENRVTNLSLNSYNDLL